MKAAVPDGDSLLTRLRPCDQKHRAHGHGSWRQKRHILDDRSWFISTDALGDEGATRGKQTNSPLVSMLGLANARFAAIAPPTHTPYAAEN